MEGIPDIDKTQKRDQKTLVWFFPPKSISTCLVSEKHVLHASWWTEIPRKQSEAEGLFLGQISPVGRSPEGMFDWEIKDLH